MTVEKLHSYPSIFNLGHKAVAELLQGPVIIEEKVDGSQISFGVDGEGHLHVRSKGAVIQVGHPEGLFDKGVEVILGMMDKLHKGWTYRGEYLKKPKHNTLAYDRIPDHHIIIFDIDMGLEDYLSPPEKLKEAYRLDLEVVPVLWQGDPPTLETLKELLETTSILGGQKIEGVVVKPANYDLYGPDKKVLMGKFVSEVFKEVHGGEWRANNPGSGDIIQQLIEKYRTPARWQKAVQHLRESGLLTDSPADIGPLMKEASIDTLREEEENIKFALLDYAWKKISRGITAGLPEWYKEELLTKAFEGGDKELEGANSTGG